MTFGLCLEDLERDVNVGEKADVDGRGGCESTRVSDARYAIRETASRAVPVAMAETYQILSKKHNEDHPYSPGDGGPVEGVVAETKAENPDIIKKGIPNYMSSEAPHRMTGIWRQPI